jgi:hypothetical protein
MPAVDELELVRQLLAGPGPRADVTTAGRARLQAIAAREAGEWGRARDHASPSRVRRRVALACAAALTCGAAVAAAVTATALVAVGPGAHAGHRVAVPPATGGRALAQSPASVRRAILAAFTGVGRDILYVRRTGQGPASAVPAQLQEWFWPSQPAPGQRVRMLIVSGGVKLGVTFTAGRGDAYTVGGTGTPITGTALIIDDQDRTWSLERDASPLPKLPRVTSVAVLRQAIAADDWTVNGRTTFAGQAAIELTTTRTAPNGLWERLWVSAQTYQPLRFVKQDWNGPGTALVYDFGFLAPTPARLAMLTPAVPAGYQQVPAP